MYVSYHNSIGNRSQTRNHNNRLAHIYIYMYITIAYSCHGFLWLLLSVGSALVLSSWVYVLTVLSSMALSLV